MTMGSAQQHCYVTGGSSGLGLALAEELARKGAHITIVARDVRKLKSSVDRIKASPSLMLLSLPQLSRSLRHSEVSRFITSTTYPLYFQRSLPVQIICSSVFTSYQTSWRACPGLRLPLCGNQSTGSFYRDERERFDACESSGSLHSLVRLWLINSILPFRT
jgi:hypothetical protein